MAPTTQAERSSKSSGGSRVSIPSSTPISATDEPKDLYCQCDIERQNTWSDNQGVVIDPVFGNEEHAAIHYRTMEWWHASILMLAEIISLGVLALPQAVARLGLVPGVLCICFLGIAATYTGYVIGQFKQAFPAIQSFADAGYLIAGVWGREIMAVSQYLILIFIMAAHILSFSIAMNVLTGHSECSVVFEVIGLLICFVLGLPRTFKMVSYLSIFSCISVIVAVTLTMIAIGVSKPDMGNIVAVRLNISLIEGLGPVMNIVLAFAGHVAYFSISAELKDPRAFTKALLCAQTVAITFYLLISCIIYYFAGPLVSSPALGSASPIVAKIAFGVALPTIIIAGVVNGTVACKYVYIRMWKGTGVIHESGFKSVGSWWGVCAGCWVLSWIIAGAVPNFNLLLGLIAALFCSWFSYGLPGVLWLYLYKEDWFSSKRRTALFVVNAGIVVLGTVICVLGMYSSGIELSQGAAGEAFSCKDNWHPSTRSVDKGN